MSKYQNGKIYKITNEDMPGLVYYGSTILKLNKRLSQHRYDCLNKNISSKILFNTENYKIELVELYSCESKKQLCEREGWYIQNNDCINKLIAGRTVKEYLKEYRKLNKQYYKEYSKEYRKLNKDKINQKHKEYYKLNKNKDIWKKAKEKVKCECGAILSRGNLIAHKKTKKHLNYSSSSNPIKSSTNEEQ